MTFTLLVEPRIGQSPREFEMLVIHWFDRGFSRTRTTKSWEVTPKSDASGLRFLGWIQSCLRAVRCKLGPLLYHSAEHNPCLRHASWRSVNKPTEYGRLLC